MILVREGAGVAGSSTREAAAAAGRRSSAAPPPPLPAAARSASARPPGATNAGAAALLKACCCSRCQPTAPSTPRKGLQAAWENRTTPTLKLPLGVVPRARYASISKDGHKGEPRILSPFAWLRETQRGLRGALFWVLQEIT